jgi:hypothetical protein
MAILNNSNAISSGGYDINNSLRFRASASAYLNRTPASAGNRKTWTWSGWVKRGTLGTTQRLFGAGPSDASSPFETLVGFTSADKLELVLNGNSGSIGGSATTSGVFRDPSAWYHIVAYVDMASSGQGNKARIYVNGNQQTVTYSSLGTTDDTQVNNNVIHRISANSFALSGYFDGYMTEVNFIDGQALTPSSFGETDTTTGSWKPKPYSGTYGTNGFYLKFSDIATTSGSNAGLGKDFSGNTNYWTTNNISVTAGTTYDAMTDVPTLTSATVANYATLNPLNLASSGVTSTNANLLATSTGAAYRSLTSTIDLPTGSWYFEITAGANSAGDNVMVGIQPVTENLQSNYVGSSATSYGYGSSGKKYNSPTAATYGATWTSGDVIGIAFNGSTLTFYKNGTSQGDAYTGLSGNFVFSVSAYNSSASVNFGQRPFSYTPPTGFKALNTFNLPDSTIVKGNTVMDATLYTGTGASLSITNAGAFKPDFVWMKGRSNVRNNNLYDSVRGTTKELSSNSTGAESTNSTGLTAFNSNGWTIGSDGGINTSSETYVGWQWQAGQGTTSSNTNGSITSTVSVNATAGFSIVTYTGNSTAGATVGHGLGVAPAMIITKTRSTALGNWGVYHASLGATKGLNLNNTIAAATLIQFWNNTAPTSSVFSVGTSNDVNGASTYVAYCWAEIAGFSKFGSYTGNGSTDGPFVYTGFRPKYVMIKRTDTTSNWVVMDTSRGTYNASYPYLDPDLSDAEGGPIAMDFLSNGFKLRLTSAAWNASGGTYIFMAFAENPFKNANAR